MTGGRWVELVCEKCGLHVRIPRRNLSTNPDAGGPPALVNGVEPTCPGHELNRCWLRPVHDLKEPTHVR